MTYGSSPIAALIMGVIVAVAWPSPALAATGKARVAGLSDVSFGLIAGTADQAASQSVCVFSSTTTAGYSVTATGSGTGGSFALTGGPALLPYDVLWSGNANQSSGAALVAGVTTSGFTSLATQQTCNSGPSATASLTVIIRASTLSAASAGSYSGTLQITIAPE